MPVLAVASAVALAAAFPTVFPFMGTGEIDPHGRLEWLAWVGLVPLLASIDRARTWRGAGACGLLAGTIFGLVLTYWLPGGMAVFGFRSRAFCVGLWLVAGGLVLGLHWALAASVAFLVRKKLGWPYWAHLPFSWAATELLRSYVLAGFAWGNLGYSQARHGCVSQLASLGGVYLVAAFLVFVSAGLFEVGTAVVRGESLPIRALSVGVAVVAAVLGFGTVRQARLRREMRRARVLRVAALQPNLSQAQKTATTSTKGMNRLLPLTRAADREGAELVVWPETAFPGLLPSSVETFTDVPGWPTEPFSHAYVLVGTMTFLARGAESHNVELRNGALLVSPSHEVLGRYSKQHLVPFAEYGAVRPGVGDPLPVTVGSTNNEAQPLMFRPTDGARVKVAPLICSDAFVPGIARAEAKSDSDFFVVMSNEAWSGRTSMPYQAQAIAQLRAVETGKPLVRASYAGPTAVLLPTGEVAAGALPVPEPQGNANGEPLLLVVDAPRLRGATVYTRIGDVFAWSALVFTCGALALAIYASRGLRRSLGATSRSRIGTAPSHEQVARRPRNGAGSLRGCRVARQVSQALDLP